MGSEEIERFYYESSQGMLLFMELCERYCDVYSVYSKSAKTSPVDLPPPEGKRLAQGPIRTVWWWLQKK